MAAPSDKPVYQLYTGIDIAARTFTAATARREENPTKASSFEQTPTGFDNLKKLLLAKGADPASILIVMEATGTYWIELATYLEAAGFGVSVLNIYSLMLE